MQTLLVLCVSLFFIKNMQSLPGGGGGSLAVVKHRMATGHTERHCQTKVRLWWLATQRQANTDTCGAVGSRHCLFRRLADLLLMPGIV